MNPTAVVNFKAACSTRHCRSQKAQGNGKRRVIPKGLAGIHELAHAEHGSAWSLVNSSKSYGRGAQLWHQHHDKDAARTASNREGNGAAEHRPNQKEQLEEGQP